MAGSFAARHIRSALFLDGQAMSDNKHSTLLAKLNIADVNPGACWGADGWISDPNGPRLVSYSPATGEGIASVVQATATAYEAVYENPESALALSRIASKRVEELLRIDSTLEGLREHLKAAELSLQVGSFGFGGRPCGFAQRSA